MSSCSLKYGHIIRIKPNDPRTVSYITSKSYTDPKLYFHTYGFEESDSKIDISNYRESLFEILPTSSFEINDEMNSLKSDAKKEQIAPRAKTQQEQFKGLIDEKRGNPIFFGNKVVFKHLDSKHYIYGSFDCAQSGIGAFKIDLRKQLSEKLVFQLFSYRTYEKDGDEISIDAPLKIYHFQTQCYLSFCMQPIFLDRDFSKSPIKQEDQFALEPIMPCLLPSLRVFYSQRAQNSMLEEIEEQLEQSKVIKEIITDQKCRYQIINENIAKRIWKFQPYLDVETKPNRQIIRNHDIVYLLHTKDDKYLCPNNFNEDIFLNKRINAHDLDSIFDGLWEIEEKTEASVDEGEAAFKNAKLGGNRRGLLSSFNPMVSMNVSFRKTNYHSASAQAQKKDEKQKQKSTDKKTYSLRHLLSGRILYFTSIANKDDIQIQLLHAHEEHYKIEKENQKHGFVMLECLESNLIDGALTRLNIDNGKHYLQIKPQQKNQIFIKSKQERGDEQQQLRKEREELKQQAMGGGEDELELTYQSNFDKQYLEAVKDASEHGFRIYKVQQSTKEIALMVMSSQEIIQKFTKFLMHFDPQCPVAMKSFGMALFNNVINVLKGLIGFIYDCQYTKIVSSGNSPNALRQRAFDEMGMVQQVTVLINQIQKIDDILRTSAEEKGKISEYKKVRIIYALGYEVLESMAAYNYMLKIKISKYLEIYLKHIISPQNRIAYKSIQEILDSNELALQKKVNETYIKALIATFGEKDTTADPADLQFLSKLCLCQNRTVQKNQNTVFISFYEQNNNLENKFFFQEDHGKYQISSKISKKQDSRLRTLPELYLECEMSNMDGVDSSKGHWNYFIQYLNLLADVCVHRNIAPLKYISENLPLKTLKQFLQEKLVRNKLLHQPFIRLVHHAFIENENFKEISRITKVKNWSNLGDFSIPKSKHPVSRQINDIIDIVIDYIKKINLKPWTVQRKLTEESEDHEPVNIQLDPDNMTSLNNINTFLQILKSTLILGFWPSMDKLKKLVPYMLKIISFDIQYAKRLINDPKVRKSIVHVSEQDLLNKIYRRVKQQLRLNKSNITLLVRCKILAAQILDVIIDYQFNIRVSMITKHFRDVQEQEVNLKNYPYKEYQFKKKWKHNKEYEIFKPDNEKEGNLMNEKLWVDKINQIIENGNVFKYCGNTEGLGNADQNGEQGLYGKGINWMLVLFQAFIYGDRQLTNIILSILIRTTNQRRQMLNTFKQIIIVAGGNLNKLTDRVLITRNSLLKLSTTQVYDETYAKGNLWKKIKLGPSTQANILGTIQELAFLTVSMKKDEIQTQARASKLYVMADLYPFRQFDAEIFQQADQLEQDRSYQIITQMDENNPLNQNLIKGQDHHLLILTFIKLMQKLPKQKFPMMALHASYNFLTVLVWNNIENKNELERILPEAENHLPIAVGCIDFFQQMYKNNSKLVLKTDVTRIVNRIIDEANNQDIKYFHKSKLLDFLRTIIIFDNKGIQKNQNIVMEIISQYQVSDNNQIVYLKVQDGISKRIQLTRETLMDQYREIYIKTIDKYQNLNISSELFYVATFFEIFSGLIENQNKVNIGKCTNMHPHQFLVNLQTKYRPCWPIVRHLRSYINKLYYFQTRDKDTQLFNKFIKQDLLNIREQLREILILIVNAPDYDTIKIENPIRYSFLGSYIFLALEECLHSLSLMFSLRDFTQHLSMTLNQEGKQTEETYFALLFIIQMVQYLMKNIDGRYINKYLSLVSHQIKKIVSQCPIQIVKDYIQYEKKQISENISKYKFSSDDGLFRKNYVFHDHKGFWENLIDWNAHIDQQLGREKALNTLSKKNEKDFIGDTDGDRKKRRDYHLEKIYLANIQKLILRKDPQRRAAAKDEVNEELSKKQQQMIDQGLENMLPKNLVTSSSQRFKVKNQRFTNAELKNAIINQRRKKLVKFIQINPELSKFAQDETVQKLYKGFTGLTHSSIKKYGIEVVGKEDVIKMIVDMNKRDPKSIKIEFKLEIIKMLTSFIQQQSQIFQSQIQYWNLTDKDEIQRIKEAQDFLNNCDCAEFLCSLFENDMNESITMSNQIILFGILMLYHQNTNVQNSILKILKRDEKNVILSQLDQLIKKNSISIAYYKPYQAKAQYPLPMNYSDTFDFFTVSEKIMVRKFTYIPETILQQKQFEEKMTFLQRIFIFLKVLCEGSNQEIKNFIRDQASSQEDRSVGMESINFISLSASELKRLFTNFRMQLMKVPIAIVDFINQVTRIPCIKNQLFLCEGTTYFHDFAQLQREIQADIIDITDITNKKFSKDDIHKIGELLANNVKNCISCLQGNHEEIRKSLISGDLHIYYAMLFKFFIDILPSTDSNWRFQSYDQLEELMANVPIYQGKILRLFDITTVIMKLRMKQPQFYEKTLYILGKQDARLYFDLFSVNQLGIEISMDKSDVDNQQCQIQYFPHHPVYHYLSRTTRLVIMDQIDRNTQRDKIIGLINTTQQISQEINYNFTLDHSFSLGKYPITISASKITKFQSISLVFAMTICVLMTASATVVYYPDDQDIQYDLGSYYFLIRILSVVEFLFAVLYSILWYINHTTLAVGRYQLDKQDQLKKDGKIVTNQIKMGTVQKILFKIPGIKLLYCLLLYDKDFPGFTLFMFGSIMGTFFKPEWFSVLTLIIMMKKIDVLKSMVDSITSKIDILLMLSLLGTAFIAIFSIFSFTFYAKSLYEEQVPSQHCESVFDCIVELYIQGQINSEMQSFESGRFLFDMIYMIFMDTLFSQILGGVLIDTFTQLREKRDQIINDKENMCFVCGITREVLEKKNQDIKTHYKYSNHKLWNYVFYIYDLNLKSEKKGLELIISDKIEKQDVSWVPVEGDDEQDIGERIKALEAAISCQYEVIKQIQVADN